MKDYKLEFSLPLEALEEKKISSTPIFDGKVLHVRLDEITLPNGKSAIREYCHHNGAVCVIPITDEGEVICVRQYRYPVADVMLEIPAGKLDYKEEDPREAALRELREETGATCKNLTFMGKYYSSPAILDECIYMYMAEGLEFGKTNPDDDEFLETVRIPIDELVAKIMRGEVPDGKTQTAVMRAKYALSERD